MKFSCLRFAIVCASAYAIATPAHAQFDQLNKALGGLSKQIEKDKSKKAPASDPSPAASNVANPPTQQESSSATSQDANFCFDRKKTECFNGSKVAYQGQFDITGMRLGKVDIADVRKRVSGRSCETVTTPMPISVWNEAAQVSNFTLDKSLALENQRVYFVECRDISADTKYTYTFIGHSDFPDYFAASQITVITNAGEISTFTRETPVVKALIDKFGEPKLLSKSVANWEGKMGEVVQISFVQRNRREIEILLWNRDYNVLFMRDTHKRLLDARVAKPQNQSVPRL